ncbi:MAG TPA: siroheme synthase CysG [Xanthobacteraceae bacterium]|nr:siroheme synthase CysG [Xanthobacteraceae bacterium]
MQNLLPSRKPSEAKPGRMGRLARLPVFFALEGKRALVAAEGMGAAWKIELLSAAGAAVDVYAPKPGADILALAEDAPGGAINIHHRAWIAQDFENAAIAVGTFKADEDAARFAVGARAAGVPVNVIDKPAFCDFAFGSIVNRSPLVIGISTDGAAPVFGQAIRAKLEAMLPAGFASWADAARRWRGVLQAASGLSFAARRRFWQLFTARALAAPEHVPGQADYESLLRELQNEGDAVERGSVTLVGAGPGDPELLTLRAVRALQSADVILIDDLVSGGGLDFARREAKKMMVGKTGGGPACKQDDINKLMVSLALKGKRVVRLKGGDPMIFGRGGEEIEACRAAGIAIEVVPGVTAAQGAASRLQLSLTHRRLARRLQYVTGHALEGKLPADLDWRSIADASAVTAIYMPSRTLAEFSERAIAAGLDPETPAIAVRNATRENEASIRSTLRALPGRMGSPQDAGPVIVLIGNALKEEAHAALVNAPEVKALAG